MRDPFLLCLWTLFRTHPLFGPLICTSILQCFGCMKIVTFLFLFHKAQRNRQLFYSPLPMAKATIHDSSKPVFFSFYGSHWLIKASSAMWMAPYLWVSQKILLEISEFLKIHPSWDIMDLSISEAFYSPNHIGK